MIFLYVPDFFSIYSLYSIIHYFHELGSDLAKPISMQGNSARLKLQNFIYTRVAGACTYQGDRQFTVDSLREKRKTLCRQKQTR
jgi:hypothetical protein